MISVRHTAHFCDSLLDPAVRLTKLGRLADKWLVKKGITVQVIDRIPMDEEHFLAFSDALFKFGDVKRL